MNKNSTHKIFLLLVSISFGCQTGSIENIDKSVEKMILEQRNLLGENFVAPKPIPNINRTNYSTPKTKNQKHEDLIFKELGDLEPKNIIVRLNSFNKKKIDAVSLDIGSAITWASKNSREYVTARESFVLSCLSLISERFLWGPQFSNTVTSTLDSDGDDGFYQSSLSIINDLSVTKKLWGGGEVGIQALGTWAKSLNESVSTNNRERVDFLMSLVIPLSRGSGEIARENLIQSERNLVYASRNFERFRRNFLLQLSDDFLNLVVLKQRIESAQRRVDSLKSLAKRQLALYESGRKKLYDSQLAENNVLTAVSQLNTISESYRLSLDRFKTRIGWPVESDLIINASSFNLKPPSVSLKKAVETAFEYRLDLQNEKDAVEDARRSAINAKNELLPSFDFSSSVGVPARSNLSSGGIKYHGGDIDYSVGLNLDVPINPIREEVEVKRRLILAEQKKRAYVTLKDNIAINVRAAVRNIDSALLTLELQKKGVKIAKLGQESILARQDSATVLEQLESINNLLSAENDVSDAKKNLQSSILRYLLETGQLRVDGNNLVKPLVFEKTEDQDK